MPSFAGYMNDYALLYSPDDKAFLENVLNGFGRGTTVQIALVTFTSSMIEGMNFDSLTLQMAKRWGMQKETKKYVMIGICTTCHKIAIYYGYEIKKIFSDKDTKAMMDKFSFQKLPDAKYYDSTVSVLHGLTGKIIQVYKPK